MTTQNDLIRAIIDKKIQEEIQKSQMEQQNRQNPLDRINGISSKVGNFGEGLSDTGSFLSNNFSSMGKIGNSMQTIGNSLQTGANAVQKAIPTSSGLMKNIATNIGSKIGSALGIGSAGATGAAATAGTTAAGTAGASVGAGAAGGAAAGGSAAGGAAAAGPIGALIALGVMALQGTNRKRSKQSNAQAQQLAESQVDIAKQRLAQTGQIAEMLGNSQPQQNDYLTQFGGDTQTRSVTGNADRIDPSHRLTLIDNYINSQTPDNSQLPQTPITSAIDNTIQNPQQAVNQAQNEETAKKGIFDKLANGLGDFLTGYKENRENGFDPNNLRPVDNKGFMQRMGEGVGTVTRMAQNPITQGLVAGGLSTALTGNPLYGLGMANKFANNKMNSDLYQQILKNQGVNFNNYHGVITSDDMSKILAANKYQKGFMTRKDYDRLRLENGLISVDEYNQEMSAPDYNPDEMVNLSGLETVSKAGRNMQQNKNDKSANYYRAKNEGKNVIKVEYGEKPDSHNYTHVTYGAKPEQKSTTHITYGEKPQSHNNTGGKKDNTPRVKVKSPDGKVGSIPASQLAEAIKKGYKKL